MRNAVWAGIPGQLLAVSSCPGIPMAVQILEVSKCLYSI
jgi:hypothetical protein